MQIYHDKTINTVYIDEGSRLTTLDLTADVDEVASIVKTKSFTEIITKLIGVDAEWKI